MDKLTIPEKLYGRDKDIITMLESFERSNRGLGEVLLVHGTSGAGKTSLIEALKLPVRERNGFFIKGKFDQFRQNIPYFAFRQALAQLCREFQSANPQQQSRFKSDIQQAIGNSGQLLVDLVPEFETFLGPQPCMREIGPQEARHRFAEVIRNFFKTVCRPEQPLVLFIDDWQWADAASLELLKQIQVGTKIRYILTIVSYRDNEADSSPLPLSTLDDLKIHSVPVSELEVKNITVQDIREMVMDTLNLTENDVNTLATFIHSKTMGNPFFVRSLILFLNELDFICFDYERNCWLWHKDKAEKAKLPSDVVELFAIKLRGFDLETRNLFSLAACLGNRFVVEKLAVISGLDADKCLALLFSKKAQGIFLVVDVNETITSNSPVSRRICAFRHDRLQQAAYMSIELGERPSILLKIGRLLLASLNQEQLSERMFEVVSNLNAGFDLIHDTSEQIKVVELNISAARKAYAATAYSSALQFYRVAASFLEKPDLEDYLWRSCHDLAMALFMELAGCEFLVGDRKEAEKCIQQTVAHSDTALEKAEAFSVLIVQYTLLARYPEAIAAGRQALDSLQISLPEDDYEIARDQEIALARESLKSRSVSSLFDLPVMSNPEMLMASKIMITMGPPCYRSHQRLWSVIVPKVINLTLQYGNIPQVGYSHTAFGGLLGWVDDDYATAREFGDLATRLMDGTFRNPTDQSVFYLMIGSSLRHWSKHLRYCTQDYRDAYEIGLRSSNLQYAAYAFGHNMYCGFYLGTPLSQLIQESLRSLEFSRTRLNQWAIDLLEGGLNLFNLLAGETSESEFKEPWSEEEYLGRVEGHSNIQVTCIYRIIKTFSLLVAGDYDDALELSDATEPLIYTVGTQGLLPWPEHVFTRFLIFSALFSGIDEENQPTWRSELDRIMGKLRIWAENCPENYEHKYLLAAAELARIDERPLEAMRLYDEAVEAAHKGGFLQWEGISNERAYSFYLGSGHGRLAQVYWQRAYECYARWGAAAKVLSMENSYRRYLTECLSAAHGGRKPAEKSQSDIKDNLVERQISQLRQSSVQIQQAALRNEAVTLSSELADAMQRLRVEMANHTRTAEALRESESRYKGLFVKAPLGIALIDSVTGHIYEANPMFAQIAGRTPQEMTQLDLIKITHPDDIQEDLDNMTLLNAGKITGFQMEKRYIHPDGSVVWINMTVAPENVKDKAHPRHLCMLEDITYRKRAEEEKHTLELQLQHTQKLESLGLLAGGIAHDFNNILTTLYGNITLAKRKLAQDHPGFRFLAMAEESMHKATFLTSQLLTFAKGGEPVKESLDLALLVEEVVKFNLAGSKVKPVFTLADSLWLASADQQQILQVFASLTKNAREAMPEGGQLHLSMENAKVTENALGELGGGNYLRICVTDEGAGIAPEHLARIFELYFTTKQAGRGIGLATARSIINKHGGQISVTSQPGKGTTFTLYLPAAGLAEPPLEQAETAAASIPEVARILVMDDEELICRMLQVMLPELGFTVETAPEGRQAIEVYRQAMAGGDPFAVVIVDLTVHGGMGGQETAKGILQMDPGAKIIASSGYSDDPVMANYSDYGFQGIAPKPYCLDKLSEVLAQVMEKD